MSTADECRSYARACLELAESAASPQQRLVLLQMAQACLSLARQGEGIDGLLDQARHLGVIPRKGGMH